MTNATSGLGYLMASVRQAAFPGIGAEMKICTGGLLGSCSQNQQLQEGGKQDWQREDMNTIAVKVEASINPRGTLRLE